MLSDRKRIWIVSARVGAGHVQAARAVEEALRSAGRGDDVRMVDVMTVVPAWHRRLYAGGYAWIANRAPGCFGALYHSLDTVSSSWPTSAERVRIAIETSMVRRLRPLLLEDRPDWIIHTHFLFPAVAGRWIKSAGLETRQAIVVTDFHPHRIWVAEPAACYCVGDESTRDRLLEQGVEAAKVHVTGIPIMAKHRRAIDQEGVFREFDWPPGRPVLLVVAGSDFVVGPFEQALRSLLLEISDVTVQVVAGNNKRLEAQLRGWMGRFPSLRVVGFTDRMHELIASATIVLSKSGGITTSEVLAHGAAMIALFPVPGQEELNADLLVAHGAGFKATTVDQVVPMARGLLSDPTRLAAVRAASKQLGKPMAATQVVAQTIGIS